MLPYFRRLESDSDIQDDFHGTDGPIPVWRHPQDTWLPIQAAFYRACADLGFPEDSDMNHPEATGVGAFPLNNPGRDSDEYCVDVLERLPAPPEPHYPAQRAGSTGCIPGQTGHGC